MKHSDTQGEGTRKVKGSYKGAMGEFACTGACTSRKTNDGIQLLGGTWAFTPDTGQKYKLDDPHYAQFGWWINENDLNTGGVKAGAWYGSGGGTGAARGAAFVLGASANSGITADEINAATGSATYTGHAIGQAAFYDATTDDENIGGGFTATATLKADFDGTPMLGGEITGFKVGGVDTDWKVELEKAIIVGSDGGVGATINPKTKWTAGGTAADAAGDWSAHFYDLPEDQHQPTGVAGGFQAEHGDEGRMVGAFGAER